MDISKLKNRFKGEIITDSETLQTVANDFGRLIFRRPAAIVAPASSSDVRVVIETAADEGWTLSTRGAAHSQGGQCLGNGGLMLDTLSLNAMDEIEGDKVWVDAGVTWFDLVDHVARHGLVPLVLTNNLNVTVGGSLSVGGIGVASHRYGTQLENVEALEVVTGSGDIARCSREENRQLFDCVLGGLGQFGVITRAQIRLRQYLPFVRTLFLLYDDLERVLRDFGRIFREDRFDFIEAWCTPCPQGMRRLGDTSVTFAEWFYPIHVSIEYGNQLPNSEALLSGLNFYRHVHTEDMPFLDYLRRMEPVFQTWRESGSWRLAHPWMEVLLPWDRSVEYIQGILKSFPPTLLTGGQALLWPIRSNPAEAPLFMRPSGESILGFGILPAVPHHLVGMAVSLLNRASDLVLQVGGKRYLSGWVEFSHQQWKAHYEENWTKVVQSKRFYDPSEVLNPGLIAYLE